MILGKKVTLKSKSRSITADTVGFSQSYHSSGASCNKNRKLAVNMQCHIILP